MKMLLWLLVAFFSNAKCFSQEKAYVEPFSNGDYSWLNGGDRRDSSFLRTKYFTGNIILDVNYSYSFNNPIDHTVVGSTALARTNEVQLSYAGMGGDFYFKGARARIMTQFGTRSTVVPRNDFSVYRGQYDLANVYRYISEAYTGYHWNKLNGINVDLGMFMSYIGLFSYYNCENWAYQPSYTSDNTPWFFNGARIQIFPAENIKVELWIINGWQAYGKFNELPGIGGQFLIRPNESTQFVSNTYFGNDAAGISGRKRFHTDNSFLKRYYNNPLSSNICRAALSFTADLGFEKGGGVNAFHHTSEKPEQNFLSAMLYHRLWFCKNRYAWTIGGGFVHNPGRYLVLLPTGDASPLPDPANPSQTLGKHPFSANPGVKFDAWDVSTTFDWMPDQSITWRIEFIHRRSSVNYFAGKGGVTSPSGYTTTQPDSEWSPDLVKGENRILLAVLFRL